MGRSGGRSGGRIVALGLALSLLAGAVQARPLVVFAAASLKTAMDDVAAAWEAETGGEVAVSYAGSSALARQIEQGAPADVFISANTAWMDELEAAGRIEAESRRDLLGNSLVLIAHGRDAAPLELGPGADIAGRLGDARLAMALVDAVPAGIYGKEALSALGLWESLAPRVAQADNVRAALALVARGEAPLGIVYATDAAVQDNVTVVGTFPEDSHEPIVYPAALLDGATAPEAQDFLEFLGSGTARPLFARQGFSVLE